MEVGRIDPGCPGIRRREMGTHTSLAPLYAYAPIKIGERAFFEIPRETAARTPRSLRAFMLKGWGLRWPWKGRPPPECSKPTVEHLLAPALRPRQVVVLDNLGAHRPKRVRELIEEQGLRAHLLAPLLSPDLNPIEEKPSRRSNTSSGRSVPAPRRP
jgi:GAF domain-containing protein